MYLLRITRLWDTKTEEFTYHSCFMLQWLSLLVSSCRSTPLIPQTFSWDPGPATRQKFSGTLNVALKKAPVKGLCRYGEGEEVPANPLILAYKMKELLDSGVFGSKAELARRYGWSRARVTQIMNLLKLPEEIQAVLLDPKNQNVTFSCPFGKHV